MSSPRPLDSEGIIREDDPTETGWWVQLTRDHQGSNRHSDLAKLRPNSRQPQRCTPAMVLASNSFRLNRPLRDDRAGGHFLRAPPHPQRLMGRAGVAVTSPARARFRYPTRSGMDHRL